MVSQGDGAWKLTTPELSRDLYEGVRTFTIFAKDKTTIINRSYQVKLQKIEIVPLKITQKITSEKHLFLSWTKLKPAYYYTVSIKNIQNGKILKIETQKSQITATLEPGNSYNIILSVSMPKTGEIVGTTSSNISMPGKIIASPVTEVKPVKKEIGQGASTVSEKVKGTNDQKVVTPSPTPAPSSSPQGEEKEGWSRLLVALAILVIAAGAAIGGYYGYEWYAGRSDDKSEPKSGSRW